MPCSCKDLLSTSTTSCNMLKKRESPQIAQYLYCSTSMLQENSLSFILFSFFIKYLKISCQTHYKQLILPMHQIAQPIRFASTAHSKHCFLPSMPNKVGVLHDDVPHSIGQYPVYIYSFSAYSTHLYSFESDCLEIAAKGKC